MPAYFVTSPQGQKFKVNAPEGASQEQVISYAQGQFQKQAPGDYGFSDKRLDNVSTAIEEFQSGKTGQTQAGFRVLGQGLGAINDKIAEAIPQTAKDVAKDVYSAARDYSPFGPAMRVGESAMGLAGDAYNDFAKDNPGRALDLAAAGNLAGVASLIVPGPRIVGETADAAGEVGRLAASGVDKLNTKTVRPTAAQLKEASTANYAKAKDLGGVLKPEANDEFINFAQNFGHKDEMASVFAGESPLAGVAKELENYKGQSMTLDRATALDQAITDRLDDKAFHDNGVLNVYGRQLLEIKNKLRSTLTDAADKGQIEGGREGIDAYRTAVKDWAAQSQINEINRIVDRASYMDNPATALKTGFRNIATNPGRLGKFPPEVQKAIKNAARDGDIANLLRTKIGSRLISSMVGAATGSAAGPFGTVAGALAGGAASGVARRTAESMQMGRVNKVVDAIAANSSLPTTTARRIGRQRPSAITADKVAKVSEPLMLPAPGYRAPMTDSQIKAARAQMATGGPTRSTAGYGDVPYNYIAPEPPVKPLALPAPGTTYAPSPVPITDKELAISRSKMRGGKLPTPPMNEAVIKPPVSQFTRIKDSLGKTKGKQFDNLTSIFLDGDMSQNAFVKYTKDKYGLSETKARSLAKELKTYGKD